MNLHTGINAGSPRDQQYPFKTRTSLEDADFRFVFLGNAVFCIIDLLLAIWKDEKRLKKKHWKGFLNMYYIIDTEISSRKKDYIKMIRKMH